MERNERHWVIRGDKERDSNNQCYYDAPRGFLLFNRRHRLFTSCNTMWMNLIIIDFVREPESVDPSIDLDGIIKSGKRRCRTQTPPNALS